MTKEITKDELLSPEEVCKRLDGKIKPRTLSNWRTSGRGPKFTKLGGKVVYPKSKLDEWLEKRTVENTSQYRK